MEHFDLPEPWSESDKRPEPGAPQRILHLCDYGFDPSAPGLLDFHYNYFVYHWQVGGKAFHARAYNDTMEEVSVYLPFEELRKRDCEPIVTWLKRRFCTIKTFEQETRAGYVTRWTLRLPAGS